MGECPESDCSIRVRTADLLAHMKTDHPEQLYSATQQYTQQDLCYVDLSKFTRDQLVAKAEDAGLPAGGSKDDLIQRLLPVAPYCFTIPYLDVDDFEEYGYWYLIYELDAQTSVLV